MTTKALLFDFGGTLDSDGVPWKERFFRLWREEAPEIARERFDPAFYAADDALVGNLPKALGLGETVERLARGVAEKLRSEEAVPARVAERFLAGARENLARSAELLAKLEPRYELGVVSNFFGNLPAVCEEAGLARFLSAVVDSAAVGCCKPEAEIFRSGLRLLGAEASETVFVGDSRERDMAGSRALGMRHVLLAEEGAALPPLCCPGDAVIRRLSELEEVLAGAGRIRAGGILAAGEGSRLRGDGWKMAKPLVPVEGVALVEHVIENFRAAGIEEIAIIFNEAEEDCARFVRSRFAGAAIRVLVKTTASSYESFREIAAMLPPGPALVSTVDAFCLREDFLEFVRRAGAEPSEETLLAVTPFVADEKPLWAKLDASGRVTALGGPQGDAVTAGMYVFPESVRKLPAPPAIGRLREYLAWLVERGEPVRAISIQTVVDVDRGEDVALAESLAAGGALRRDRAENGA